MSLPATFDKVRQLLDAPLYPLAEIACLTGFSDQSPFTQIFKQHTGQNPSVCCKNRPRT